MFTFDNHSSILFLCFKILLCDILKLYIDNSMTNTYEHRQVDLFNMSCDQVNEPEWDSNSHPWPYIRWSHQTNSDMKWSLNETGNYEKPQVTSSNVPVVNIVILCSCYLLVLFILFWSNPKCYCKCFPFILFQMFLDVTL